MMWLRSLLTVHLLVMLWMDVQAQGSHEFTMLARISEYGGALATAVGPDGTVFAAFGHGGVRAYKRIGNRLELASSTDAHNTDYCEAIAVGPEGNVYVTGKKNGLRAYRYDGQSLVPFAHISENPDRQDTHDVAVGPDGTVFIADLSDGILAYSCANGTFEPRGYRFLIGVHRLTVRHDRTIFAGCMDGTLHALSYNSATVFPLGSISLSGMIRDVAVGSDSIVFAMSLDEGLHAIRFESAQFTKLAVYDQPWVLESRAIGIAAGGLVIVANRMNGFGLLRFTGSAFILHAQLPDFAIHVTVDRDNLLWVADEDAVHGYTLDGDTPSMIASSEGGGMWRMVAVRNDGTLFAAGDRGLSFAGRGVLSAYTFNGTSFTRLSTIQSNGINRRVSTGFDSLVLIANDGGLHVYSFVDNRLKLSGVSPPAAANGIVVSSHGEILLTCGRGLYFGRSLDGELVWMDHADGYDFEHVAVGSDGTVFVTRSERSSYPPAGTVLAYRIEQDRLHYVQSRIVDGPVSGLSAFGEQSVVLTFDPVPHSHATSFATMTFNDDRFSAAQRGYVTSQHEVYPEAAVVDRDGTIFMAGGADGVRAFQPVGNGYINTAHFHTGGFAYDVAIGTDGTVFAAADGEGIYALKYSRPVGITENVPTSTGGTILSQNFPNPFNPSTSIQFTLPEAAFVSLVITDGLGREVLRPIASEHRVAGQHCVELRSGNLKPGLYVYRLEAGGQVNSRSMLLLR